jgi:hypothetical protein
VNSANHYIRSINFNALNLHVLRQSPQALHWSGYFTTACLPVSSSTVSNTRCEHRLTQRRHPVQLLFTTQISLFLFFRLRCTLKKTHNKIIIPNPIYITFIFYYFWYYPLFIKTNEREKYFMGFLNSVGMLAAVDAFGIISQHPLTFPERNLKKMLLLCSLIRIRRWIKFLYTSYMKNRRRAFF